MGEKRQKSKYTVFREKNLRVFKKPYRIISMVICVSLIITMFPALAYAAVEDMAIEAQEEKMEESLEGTLILEEDISEENAVIEESTESSTVFDLGDGEKMVIYHGQNVRYEDEDGNLTDYDPALVKIKSEISKNGKEISNYSFENKQGDKKSYIPEKLTEDTPVLMENDKYSIEMIPLDEELTSKVVLDSEETVSPYEEIEEKKVKAIYESNNQKYRYEYTSLNEGLKETIVLEENPEDNVFLFKINVEGLKAELNEEENTVILMDKENDEVKAVIEKPFMNDDSGEAYSEDLIYKLEDGSEENSYILTLTVSREYLDDEERIYPVTIDPTATWQGEDTFLDVYVISGSSYGDKNYSSSSYAVMPAGVKSDGYTRRTYIKFPNLKADLADKYIHTAYLTLYETANCEADQTI